MKRIAVVTSTRAEFGLLSPLIRLLRTKEDADFVCELIVTGTHLSEYHGHTIDEIYAAGFRVDHEVEVSVQATNALDIARNQADVVVKFTDLFARMQYDAIIVLGDRYEMQMVAIAASNTRTAIIHLCGGDTTEGAVDESVRHSITKMSQIHFVTNEDSKKRVIQLGENPNRVFNVGSTSVDNILNMDFFTKEEALKSVDLPMCRYAIGTYHPITLESRDIEADVMNLINVIKQHSELEFLFTMANADQGGDKVNEIFKREAMAVSNLHFYSSLGIKRYLSLMRYAEFVIGNSSSGIVETPIFRVPTVNIGDRQKGRLQSKSVINCGSGEADIDTAIQTAMSQSFRESIRDVVSPYGNGHAAETMVDIIMDVLKKPIELKKQFYEV